VYLPLLVQSQSRRALPTDAGEIAAEASHEPVLAGARANGAAYSARSSSTEAGAGSEESRRLLVVEDDPVQRQYIADLMAPTNTQTVAVASGDEALALLQKERFDCVVLDLGLPGMSGWGVIEELQSSQALGSTPLLVYTAKDLTRKEEIKLGKAAKSIVIKDARSPERLKQEIAAILSESSDEAGIASQSESNGSDMTNTDLAGKRVLVVDDDIRNIFALTALLERQEMEVFSVDSGQEALDLLRSSDDIDIALVDVM